MNQILNIINKPICMIIYGIGLFFVEELFAYFWHRYISHGDSDFYILKQIQNSHMKHHNNENDLALEDFWWVLFLVLLLSIFILLLNLVLGLSIYYFIITLIVGLFSFSLNWYFHYCYHNPNSYLQQFDFFREKTRQHMLHHENYNTNYGIINLYGDYLMGSIIQ